MGLFGSRKEEKEKVELSISDNEFICEEHKVYITEDNFLTSPWDEKGNLLKIYLPHIGSVVAMPDYELALVGNEGTYGLHISIHTLGGERISGFRFKNDYEEGYAFQKWIIDKMEGLKV